MKKKIVFGSVGAVLLAASAFAVVALMGVPQKKLPPRGSADYYRSDPLLYELPVVSVNLKDNSGARFLQVAMAVQYVVGQEVKAGQEDRYFTKKEDMIADRLNLLLSDKSYADVKGSDKKLLLKEEIRHILQKIVFPEGLGRVDDILFKKFTIQ